MVLAVDFSWSLSVWVSSKVVGMGFGGWNGGGMVLGTMIMVVVASRCHCGCVWWWLGFFTWCCGWVCLVSWLGLLGDGGS